MPQNSILINDPQNSLMLIYTGKSAYETHACVKYSTTHTHPPWFSKQQQQQKKLNIHPNILVLNLQIQPNMHVFRKKIISVLACTAIF